MIKVRNIPSVANNETLPMLFETKWNDGGESNNIVYDQGQGTALLMLGH